MVSLSKDLIGKKLSSYTYTVERQKILEFCLAIGETNPIYTNQEAARQAGYEDTPIPPTFQTTFTFWGIPTFMQDIQKLGIDTDHLLHMKEEYTYLRQIYPQTEIIGNMEIADVKIGKMNMVTFRNTFQNQNKEDCIKADMTIVITPA